jgi:hypothetical protein
MVPVGGTLALFMQPQAGQISTMLKFFSGGTCEILPPGFTQTNVGVFLGTTLAAATLGAITGSGYCFSAGEALTINGPAAYYLSSTGATSILHAIFSKGQGN